MVKSSARAANPEHRGGRVLLGARRSGWAKLVVLLLLGSRTPGGLAALSLASAAPDPIGIALHTALEDSAPDAAGLSFDRERLRHVYEDLAFRPLWSDASGVLERTEYLIGALSRADEHGLRSEEYGLSEIRRLLGRSAPADRSLLDLLLTDAFLRYSADIVYGRAATRNADRSWHIPAPGIEAEIWLKAAIASNEIEPILDALPPRHAAYERLRKLLARYRELARQGRWARLPEGPTLRPSDSDRQVTLLRRRLLATGDLISPPKTPGMEFDPALAAAVRRFQARHGLKADGEVGAATRTALNVGIEKRIEQIERNMDRWRWLPRALGERYIMVNTADFDLQVVEGSETRLSMRAIVGRPDRQTPVLASELNRVVFNPYWNIPPRLAQLDLLPKQRRNPAFFSRQRIRVFMGEGPESIEINPARVDWSAMRATDFPFRLRQDPGPSNNLGRMKFLFPNPFAVYLHDTPSRRLFNEDSRTFSSGCVRIEQPEQFAAYLLGLQDSTAWNEESLHAAVASGKKRTITLRKPVPIYLVYWTAWVDGDGTVNFRDDRYHRDEQWEEPNKLVGGCNTRACVSLN